VTPVPAWQTRLTKIVRAREPIAGNSQNSDAKVSTIRGIGSFVDSESSSGNVVQNSQKTKNRGQTDRCKKYQEDRP
jgi:hypothetical protein